VDFHPKRRFSCVKLLTDDNIDPRALAWFRAKIYDIFAIAEGRTGARGDSVPAQLPA
jgi:hypothetical protein